MLKTILTRSLLLIFSFGLLCVPSVLGQTCSLRLNVRDLSKVPVSGANARAKRVRSTYRATSNNRGAAYFPPAPIGRYAITVTRMGFQPAVTTVNCNTANKSANIIMRRPGDTWKNVILKARPKDMPIKLGEADTDPGDMPTVTIDNGTISPPPTPKPVPRIVAKGVINGNAISLPKPAYPPTAKAVGASGPVNVQVTIDENGNVISATAVSGHPLLRQVSAQAARGAKFKPTLLSGQPVKVSGIIVYNFQ